MPAPTILPGRAFQQATRKSNLLLHFRASDLLTQDVEGVAGTFTRSSAGGRVLAKGLSLEDSTSGLRLGPETSDNVPRWEYRLNASGVYVPVLTLGRAYTNLVSNDAVNAWSNAAGGVTVTSGINDPAGGTSAYTAAGDGTTTFQGKYLNTTFTGDGTKCAVFVVRERSHPSGTTTRLQMYDSTAATSRLSLYINSWSSGDPQITAAVGTYMGHLYVGNGYWLVLGQAPGVVAANTNRVQITTNAAATAGSIDVYRVNVYNAAVPPPFILDAGVTSAADSFTLPFLARPQEATYLYEGVVLDLPNSGADRWLFNVGGAAGAAAFIGAYLHNSTGRIYLAFGNGSGTAQGYWSVPSLALSDLITIRTYQAGSGAITALLSVNGGAESAPTAISTIALPGSWASSAVRFSGASSTNCNSGLISFKAAAGNRSLAWMQEAY